jgi:hypothetical protein
MNFIVFTLPESLDKLESNNLKSILSYNLEE